MTKLALTSGDASARQRDPTPQAECSGVGTV
jgi:hypothetical protein